MGVPAPTTTDNLIVWSAPRAQAFDNDVWTRDLETAVKLLMLRWEIRNSKGGFKRLQQFKLKYVVLRVDLNRFTYILDDLGGRAGTCVDFTLDLADDRALRSFNRERKPLVEIERALRQRTLFSWSSL